MFSFDTTVNLSILSLAISGVLWIVLAISTMLDGRKREKTESIRGPKWEYIVGGMLFFGGLIFLSGAFQIEYDPTGLLDGFAVVCVCLAAWTTYGFYRWVTRRF